MIARFGPSRRLPVETPASLGVSVSPCPLVSGISHLTSVFCRAESPVPQNSVTSFPPVKQNSSYWGPNIAKTLVRSATSVILLVTAYVGRERHAEVAELRGGGLPRRRGRPGRPA